MKQRLFLIAALMVAMTVPHTSLAYDFSAVAPSGQTLYYNIVDGNAQVTYQNNGYPFYNSYPTGDLVILSSVVYNGNSYNVTSIGDYAFYGCTGLTSVSIGNSVTSIGDYAFYGCTGLTSVSIGNSVTSIGDYAFSGCTGLTSVSIGNSVSSIGYFAFFGCTSLTSPVYNNTLFAYMPPSYSGAYTIPMGITTICETAFRNCTGLTSVEIPNTVTNIGGGAFANCTSLGAFNIPSSVDSIGEGAFINTGITHATIPSNVTYIGCGALGYCPYLRSVNYNAGHVICSLPDDIYQQLQAEGIDIPEQGSMSEIEWSDTLSQGMYVPNIAGGLQWGGSIFAGDSIVTLYIGANVDYIPKGMFSRMRSIGKIVPQGPNPPLWNSPCQIIDSETLVDVNCQYISSYLLDTNWGCLTNYENHVYYITTISDDFSMGTTEGDGYYCENSTVTIIAVPNNGYHFTRWSDGNTDNPRQIHVSHNATYTAEFAITYYSVNVSPNDILRGSVQGGGSHYTYGMPATVEATAYSGYVLSQWSNGAYYNPYTFAVTEDVDLVAEFVAVGTMFRIITEVNNAALGHVEGGGMYGVGEYATLTAVPNDNCWFEHWQDGSTDNPRQVYVGCDATYTAYFSSPGVGISDAEEPTNISIHTDGGRIIVNGTVDQDVRVYDMMGRMVNEKTGNDGEHCLVVPSAGVYLVKVHGLPARKVVVIR